MRLANSCRPSFTAGRAVWARRFDTGSRHTHPQLQTFSRATLGWLHPLPDERHPAPTLQLRP
jgi:hypothetical protein